MHPRFIGGILLIVGTSIGAGMLALPVGNAATGFLGSTVFLILCWAFMTIGAFFILEANLYLSRGKNMVSMASATIGPYGSASAWISYLFLLYSLLSAYISGGADVLNSLTHKLGFFLRDWQASTLFTLIFGLIVYGGVHFVDYANRGLMFGKLAVYGILLVFIAPYVQYEHLQHGHLRYIGSSIMLLITSFGFAIIVPNLRAYFEDDISELKKVIFIGSLIPLICYIAWDAIIIGSLPAQGNHGLINLMSSEHTTSGLAQIISTRVQNNTISILFNLFTSICMLTAFLGVSLCLYSFLADGLNLGSKKGHGLSLFLLTFLPPLLLVIYYPGAYIHALGYAGIFCVILLLMLPALMCYYGRKKYKPAFEIPGGSLTPIIVIGFSVVLLIHEAWSLFA